MPEVTLSHCCGDTVLHKRCMWPDNSQMDLCLGCYEACTPVVFVPKVVELVEAVEALMAMPSDHRIVEVVYTWPEGNEEVHYRMRAGSNDGREMIAEVERLHAAAAAGNYSSPYSLRFVEPTE